MTTRRKPVAKPAPQLEDEIYTEDDTQDTAVPTWQKNGWPTPPPEVSSPSPANPQGCMMPIMFAMMLAMMGFMVWTQLKPPAAAPTVPDAAPVVQTLDAFTAPVKTKLATDKAKAAIVADAYQGLSDAIKGPSGKRIVDSKALEAVQSAFLTDLDAKSGPAVGAEIDTAIGSYIGMKKITDAEGTGWEPMTFDDAARSKLVEITAAISQAAGSIR